MNAALAPPSAVIVQPALTPRLRDEKQAQANTCLTWLRTAAVETQEQCDQLAELRRLLNAEVSALEAMRTSVTRPLLDAKKTVDSWFKGPSDAFREGSRLAGVVVAKFLDDQRQKARAATAAAMAAHAAGDHDAGAALATVVTESSAAQAPRGTTVRWVWTATISEPTAVPREWCAPDEQRIAEMARSTPAESVPTPIPGVAFAKVPRVTTRQ